MFLSSQVKGQRLQVGDRRRSPCEKGVEVSLRQSTRQKSCQTSKRSGPHRFSFQANGFGGELIAPQTGSLPHRPLPVGGRDVTISRLRIFNPRHSRLPACATITPTDPLSVAQIVNLPYRRLSVGGRAPTVSHLRIFNPRHSRLPACATTTPPGPLFVTQIFNLPYRRLSVGGRAPTVSHLRIFNPRHSRLPACATITPTDPLSVAQIVNLLHRWELVRQFASPAKRCSIATLPAEHTIRRSPGCCGYNAGLALSRRRCAPSGQTTPVARNSPRFGPASGWLAGPYVACGCAGFRSACNWASARSGDEHGLA